MIKCSNCGSLCKDHWKYCVHCGKKIEKEALYKNDIIDEYTKEEGGKIMKYIVVQCKPKDAEKKLNAFAEQGWRVVSQSESTWVFTRCFGLSHSVDSLLNVVMCKEQ